MDLFVRIWAHRELGSQIDRVWGVLLGSGL